MRVLLLSSILFLFACSSINCPVQNTVAVYYAFKQYDAGNELVADTLTDTLWVWTQDKDSTETLLNRLVDKSSFALPISYQHPEDVLFFAIADTAHVFTLDTVWVQKDDIPHFESVDCPAHFFHQLTSVRCTHEGIDSIVISNPSVSYSTDVINLNIFLKKRPRLTDTAEETTGTDTDNKTTGNGTSDETTVTETHEETEE